MLDGLRPLPLSRRAKLIRWLVLDDLGVGTAIRAFDGKLLGANRSLGQMAGVVSVLAVISYKPSPVVLLVETIVRRRYSH
jgi:hypothetical protein